MTFYPWILPRSGRLTIESSWSHGAEPTSPATYRMSDNELGELYKQLKELEEAGLSTVQVPLGAPVMFVKETNGRCECAWTTE